MSTDRPKNALSSTAAISLAGVPLSLPDASHTKADAPIPPTSAWTAEDKAVTREILQIYWNEIILKNKKEGIDNFKMYLKRVHFGGSAAGDEKIDAIFRDAHLDFNKFCEAIQQFPLRYVHAMNRGEHLKPPPEVKEQVHSLKKEEVTDLLAYMREEKISAAISLRADTGDLVTPETKESKAPYAIHSVGKVFTGMLALRMIQEKVILETELKQPLDVDFVKKLPIPLSLQKHLIENKISLHQLMTHHSGLRDYLDNYRAAIRQAVEAGQKPPTLSRPEDFLKYAEEKLTPKEKDGTFPFHYSNLGILLVGLAIQAAYEKKHGPCSYDEILHRYITDEAKMSCLSSQRPDNAKYNEADRVELHIFGGPAGGYWTTAEDLAKFGKWIYERCMADEKEVSDRPKLKRLMEDYGQEFYYRDRQRVEHGGTVQTGCSEFSVSLATGAVVAILSDQPPPAALDLREKVQEKIFSAPASSSPAASRQVTVAPKS